MSKDWTHENLDILPTAAPIAENSDLNLRGGLEASRYWEGQAFLWHERYKEALKYELDHASFMEALERLSSGKFTGERVRQIALKALRNRKVE